MKIGVIIRKSRIADAEPINVNRTASCAFPLSKNLCPGRTPNAVSSSGAPRYMEGIKSMNVLVIAREVIKMSAVNGDGIERRSGRRIVTMRLVWIPGKIPVRVPEMIPKRKDINN